MTTKMMNETYIEVTIRQLGQDNRKVFVCETFDDTGGVTISQLEDVFYDALRGAGYFPDGK